MGAAYPSRNSSSRSRSSDRWLPSSSLERRTWLQMRASNRAGNQQLALTCRKRRLPGLPPQTPRWAEGATPLSSFRSRCSGSQAQRVGTLCPAPRRVPGIAERCKGSAAGLPFGHSGHFSARLRVPSGCVGGCRLSAYLEYHSPSPEAFLGVGRPCPQYLEHHSQKKSRKESGSDDATPDFNDSEPNGT